MSAIVTQGLAAFDGQQSSPDVGSKKPVHQISWWETIRFCNVFSEKLGLEQVPQNGVVEWNRNVMADCPQRQKEIAARTRDDLRFSGGDDISKLGWTAEANLQEMPDVGMKEPNLWGFHDLSGLVFEWWWDDHQPYASSSAETEEPHQQNH